MPSGSRRARPASAGTSCPRTTAHNCTSTTCAPTNSTERVVMSLLKLVLGACLIAAAAHTIVAQKQAPPSLALVSERASARQGGTNATETAVTAANAFLGSLDDSKRAKANITITAQSRAIWSNLPSGIPLQTGATERNGLKLAAMTPVQEKAALALLASVLSRDGYAKAMQVV